MEILVVGSRSWSALFPAIIASFTASQTALQLGMTPFHFPLSLDTRVSVPTLGLLLVASIVFALIGNLFAWILQNFKRKIATLLPNPYQRVFLIGLLISCLALLIHSGRYAGLGSELINASLTGETIYSYDWLLKLLLTCLTLSAGFQGSEVTPLFAVGATSGAVLATFLGLPLQLTASIGLLAVFGSATNTLLAPILIGYEFFGPDNLPYFIPACLIAYLVNRQQTIYPLQKTL